MSSSVFYQSVKPEKVTYEDAYDQLKRACGRNPALNTMCESFEANFGAFCIENYLPWEERTQKNNDFLTLADVQKRPCTWSVDNRGCVGLIVHGWRPGIEEEEVVHILEGPDRHMFKLFITNRSGHSWQSLVPLGDQRQCLERFFDERKACDVYRDKLPHVQIREQLMDHFLKLV